MEFWAKKCMETNFEQHTDISYHNTRAAILAILKLIRLTFWPKIHCEVWQFRTQKISPSHRVQPGLWLQLKGVFQLSGQAWEIHSKCAKAFSSISLKPGSPLSIPGPYQAPWVLARPLARLPDIRSKIFTATSWVKELWMRGIHREKLMKQQLKLSNEDEPIKCWQSVHQRD